MEFATSPERFLELSARYPVIDVRSPAEFRRGHIPGAQNVPLFSDSERAEVGITYKQKGRALAISLGWKIVRPKLRQLVEAVHAQTPSRDVLIHCWRGGMRSNGVAQLLMNNGFRPRTLQGGYKAFRRLAHAAFLQSRRIVILSGLTGSGKTDLLQALATSGEQVIDLEALARHRGSAFGGIDQPAQPTVEQFENELFFEWIALDPQRIVWMESESQRIGTVVIPQPIWHQMLGAPAIFLQVSREERVQFLVDQYGHFPSEKLHLAILQIRKRLGDERLKQALDALHGEDLAGFVGIVLEYYDKAYTRAFEKRTCRRVTMIDAPHAKRAAQLRDMLRLAEAVA